MVAQICEAVRRHTAKKGREVNLASPPLNYGDHPYHHVGMPGTIMVAQEVVVGDAHPCDARPLFTKG